MGWGGESPAGHDCARTARRQVAAGRSRALSRKGRRRIRSAHAPRRTLPSERRRPLREAAEILANAGDWPPLYDPARLAVSEVPAAAAVYFRDMYVPVDLSLRTASAIRGLKPWVTSEYEHDGLRVSGGRVLDRLIAMNRGEV